MYVRAVKGSGRWSFGGPQEIRTTISSAAGERRQIEAKLSTEKLANSKLLCCDLVTLIQVLPE